MTSATEPTPPGRRPRARVGSGSVDSATRWVASAVVALLLGVACSSGTGDGSDGGTDGGSADGGAGEVAGETAEPGPEDEPGLEDEPGPEDEPVPPSPEMVARIAGLDGRLAIGDGGRLAVTAPDGSGLVWVEDAADVVAAQPTWSRRGDRLVWARSSALGHHVVVREQGSGELLETVVPGPPAFYFQWSADDETIAYLRNSPGGRGLEMGIVAPGDGVVPLITPAPFFISWSPTASSAIAAHLGNRQIVLLADPPAALAGEAQPPRVALEPTGGFAAPAWLDDETVLVATADGLAGLDVATGTTDLIVATDGRRIQFVPSPDRSRIAYLVPGLDAGPSLAAFGSEGSPRAPDPGPVEAEAGLVVVDLADRSAIVVTAEAPLWWQWSPDGRRLAWLEPVASPVRGLVRWNYWDRLTPEEARASPPFEMSEVTRVAYLPFFEQYAQSITGWSPDGSAFAFAGRLGSEDPSVGDSIWVQLVDDGPPLRVAEGDHVTWSGRAGG